jgi:hypothetical protein
MAKSPEELEADLRWNDGIQQERKIEFGIEKYAPFGPELFIAEIRDPVHQIGFKMAFMGRDALREFMDEVRIKISAELDKL